MMMFWGLSAVFVCLATPTRSQLIAGAESPGGMFGNLSCGTSPVVMQTRGGAKNNIELWPNGVVQYIIESSFTAVDRAVFQKSIDLIEANTCVRFYELSQAPPNGYPYMRLERECNCEETGGDCFGGGYTDGLGVASPRKLVMSAACLSEDSAENLAFMTHEVYHALGVVHTQSRPDRDVHITVNTDNIKSRFLKQYDKCSQCLTHGTIYDCNSIMHYRDNTFQKPGHGPTMTAKRDDCNLHTYPSEVTTSDWNLIKAMYNCEGCNGDDWSCCSAFNKCNIGEGDCDNDNDCKDGLMCHNNLNNCKTFNPNAFDLADCCIPCRGENTWHCCTPERPCGVGRGDCDKDSDCLPGFTCGHNGDNSNNCKNYNPNAHPLADCCEYDFIVVG